MVHHLNQFQTCTGFADIKNALCLNFRSYLEMTVHWIDETTLTRKKSVWACRWLKGRHTYNILAKEINGIHWDFQIEKKLFEAYFKPTVNVIYEKFVFNTCDQLGHESVDEYVNKLRGLSETCEFGTVRDSMIKDRIVLGTKNTQVQASLLNQQDLTLDRALSICQSTELTEQQLSRINDASPLMVCSLLTERRN